MEVTKDKLTDRQKWALYKIVAGVRDLGLDKQTLGGYAGTGKTTLIKYLVKFFPSFGVAAYTGKAANVLRKKGIMASTIHSRIYKPYFDYGSVYFDLTDDPACDGFIIDEASMVSSEIYEDLSTFNLPMIFIGDHGQLEPIDSSFNLMEKPDYCLEEIHRNAGDIARFAEHVRKGLAPRGFRCKDDTVEFLGSRDLDDELLTTVDQVICAFNKTRVETNTRIRKALGYTSLVEVGEKIMCLRNNRSRGLFNGMQGRVLRLYNGKNNRRMMDFEADGVVYEEIWYDDSQFGQESYKMKHGKDTANPFDYGPCITGHKAQGDEWEKVLVLEQKCKRWDHKRWAYTTASRPKQKLYWQMAA